MLIVHIIYLLYWYITYVLFRWWVLVFTIISHVVYY